MPSDLVQRLRNLHAHSGDPDTVAEAAQTLENLEGVCRAQAAEIKRLSVGRGTFTDEQARKVLAAVMEVQP